jgi:hypothetical protein
MFVLDGIPLAYSDVSFSEGKAYGKILAENPWLHCNILAKVILFRPIVGSWIQGQITKVSVACSLRCVQSSTPITY